MKKKFKIGDYVVVNNPSATFKNRLKVINKVAIIKKIYDSGNLPYKLGFLEDIPGITNMEGVMYNSAEFTKLKRKSDIMLELI